MYSVFTVPCETRLDEVTVASSSWAFARNTEVRMARFVPLVLERRTALMRSRNSSLDSAGRALKTATELVTVAPTKGTESKVWIAPLGALPLMPGVRQTTRTPSSEFSPSDTVTLFVQKAPLTSCTREV